jgi:hypothetical protein
MSNCNILFGLTFLGDILSLIKVLEIIDTLNENGLSRKNLYFVLPVFHVALPVCEMYIK